MTNTSGSKSNGGVYCFLPFIILGLAVYLAFSGQWVAGDINRWQMRVMGDAKTFPALTAFVIALPALLGLALLKKVLEKK